MQIVLEAIIPLAGFFLWSWSLFFLVLFYILDLLARETVTHLKAKKRLNYDPRDSKPLWIKQGVISFSLLAVAVLLMMFFFMSYKTDIDLIVEILAFWNYEDLGIEQGYFLLPLVAITAYAQYKQEFLFPARFKTAQMKEIWSNHLRTRFALLAGIGLAIGLDQLIPGLPEHFFVLSIIVLSSLYNWRFRTI